MKEPHDLLKKYPELRDFIREHREKIRAIDTRLEHLKHDSGPELNFKPPGGSARRPFGTRQSEIEQLQKQKGDLLKGVNLEIDQRFVYADQATKDEVKSGFLDIVTSQEPQSFDRKDLNASQEYIRQKMGDPKRERKNFPITGKLMKGFAQREQQDKEPVKKEKTEQEQHPITDRLMDSLDTSRQERLDRAREFSENRPHEKSKEPERE